MADPPSPSPACRGRIPGHSQEAGSGTQTYEATAGQAGAVTPLIFIQGFSISIPIAATVQQALTADVYVPSHANDVKAGPWGLATDDGANDG